MWRLYVWAGLAILAAARAAHSADEACPSYVIAPPDVVDVRVSWTANDGITGRLDLRQTVRPDGLIHLGQHGYVLIGGLTTQAAAGELRAHLLDRALDAKVRALVTVVDYRSQHLHLVIGPAAGSEQVHRLPFTGAETVLDLVASSQLIPPARCTMFVERAAADGVGPPLVLPVDWRGIVHRGDTATNYRLQADDRVIVRWTAQNP